MIKIYIKHVLQKWHSETLLGKIAYTLTSFLFFWIFFEGLILESFNIHLLGINGVLATYYIALFVALLARKWKLFFATFIGFYILYGGVILGSEILWYYLQKWFGIDISYR